REVVDTRGWATEEELADYYAIGQCTPGVIAVNTATFVGQKRGGASGGVVATLGVVFPSLVIITVIAALVQYFANSPEVMNAVAGIRVCGCGLILNPVVKLGKKTVVDVPTLLIFFAVLALSLLTDLSPVLFVLAAAAVGVAVQNLRAKR
ncbi:MAG: chromate transporter, partial [Oscillospiraceae bacterium]|nr:chromate transporter [Oscillospiraceae bacterium]